MRTEEVLVVSREDLFGGEGEGPQGFTPGDGAPWLERIERSAYFRPRPEAEDDPRTKQIIPYGMVVCGDDVFLLRRTRGGGEARLHDRFSLGVGGHINPPDEEGGPGRSSIEAAFSRELQEELVIESAFRRNIVGILDDDSDPVGRVHFGLVWRVELEEPRAHVRETEQLEGRFVAGRELRARAARMESWSRYLQAQFWP